MNILKELMEGIENALGAGEGDGIITLTREDKTVLFEYVGEIITDYMDEYILNMKKPNFHKEMNDDIMALLQDVFGNIYNNYIEEEFHVIIQKACRLYFTKVLPRRSYTRTFFKNRINKEKLSGIIEHLRNVPQHEQRTTEWYEDRWNMISASSAWKALASDSYKNSLIYEKCSPLDTDKYRSVNVDSPFHWGAKYEPLSIIIYEDKYKTKVEDFGCIPHPIYSNIGASPDGINTDPDSMLYGRMVEVKNRFSNSVPITGIPKEEYWIQMQLQMNVCDLNECDFLETRFKEYGGEEEFIQDGYGSFTETNDGKMKGIYLYFQKNNAPHYEYPPLHLTKEQYEEWETDTKQRLEGEDNCRWISNIYWYLDKMSCVLVFRNRKWFEKARIEITSLWQTVLKERKTGYEHRAPVKRKKNDDSLNKSSCMLDISLLKIN
jgi:putative phage-type endonuclease